MKKSNRIWISSNGATQNLFNWDRGQPSSGRDEIYAGIQTSGYWHDYREEPLAVCIEWND
jgi:hypothetical protein